jgi:multiple sugar transport system permease protein
VLSRMENHPQVYAQPVCVGLARSMSRLSEYAFIVPALLLLATVVLFPIVTALYLSFNNVRLVPPDSAFMGFKTAFNGLDNYVEVLTSPDFLVAFGNTVFFTGFTVVGSLGLGLAFALLLDSAIKVRSIWRILMLTPWVVSPVVAGSTWRWMYETRYGVFNALIRTFFPSVQPVLWLASPTIAMLSVSVTNVWLRTPFMMVMLLAGLQAIPSDQYEAAAVDGASAWQRFRFITIPHLRFVIMVATLLEAIWTFKHFDIVQVMTGGGPGRATELLATLIYKTSFEFFRFGPASAMGMLVTCVLSVFAVFYVRLLRSRE